MDENYKRKAFHCQHKQSVLSSLYGERFCFEEHLKNVFCYSTFNILKDSIGSASLGRLLSSKRKASLVSYLILETTSGLDNSALNLSGKKIMQWKPSEVKLTI